MGECRLGANRRRGSLEEAEKCTARWSKPVLCCHFHAAAHLGAEGPSHKNPEGMELRQTASIAQLEWLFGDGVKLCGEELLCKEDIRPPDYESG